MKARANELASRPGCDRADEREHADPRRDFPRRPPQSLWPRSLLAAADVLALIDAPPFRPANGSGYRRQGTARMLEWLAAFPGGSWQERWQAAGAEDLPKEQWLQLPMQWRQGTGRSLAPANRDSYQTGLLMLICADVIRPGLPWMVRRASNWIVTAMAACRDPGGFAAVQAIIDADPGGITPGQARLALGRITMILACKATLISDITVGDYGMVRD